MAPKSLSESLVHLLVQTCKAQRALAEKLWSEIGLHVGQDMLLLQLWPEEGLTQSELAERLSVQPATVTKTLQRMEQTGLVERRGDPDDHRLSRVYLTDQGRGLLQPYEEVRGKLEQYLVKDLSVEERLLLRRLLMQVRDNLREQL